MEHRVEPPVATSQISHADTLSEADVRHNVRVNVLVSAVFQIGAADMALASAPLLVYLGASNTLIGVVNGLGWMSIIGVLLSPYISFRCPQKKWYMFWAHVPYIGAWGLIGLAVVCSQALGLSDAMLLQAIIILSACNLFFAGFVTLPSQEFLAACIPMSHRGRYTGYSMSVGAIGSLISVSIGGFLLHYLAKPMSFGWLYLMFWFFAQGGYLIALCAREPRTHLVDPPKPWSRSMFRALKEDKKFQRVWVSSLCVFTLFFPCMIFVPIYGYKALGLPATTAAIIAIIQQVARLVLSSHIGVWTDRIGAKRMASFWMACAGLSVAPLFTSSHPLALYIVIALQAVCFAGIFSAFNPLLLGTPKPENRSGHYSVQLVSKILLDSSAIMFAGWLIDRIGFIPYFGAWAIIALLAAVFVRWILEPLDDRPENYS